MCVHEFFSLSKAAALVPFFRECVCLCVYCFLGFLLQHFTGNCTCPLSLLTDNIKCVLTFFSHRHKHSHCYKQTATGMNTHTHTHAHTHIARTHTQSTHTHTKHKHHRPVAAAAALLGLVLLGQAHPCPSLGRPRHCRHLYAHTHAHTRTHTLLQVKKWARKRSGYNPKHPRHYHYQYTHTRTHTVTQTPAANAHTNTHTGTRLHINQKYVLNVPK